MNRYQYTTLSNDVDRKHRKLSSNIYPKITNDDSDIFVITTFGDRLDLLADKYYGDVTLWWVLAQANHIGKGSLNIKPGTNLRIPQNLEMVFSDLEKMNRTR